MVEEVTYVVSKLQWQGNPQIAIHTKCMLCEISLRRGRRGYVRAVRESRLSVNGGPTGSSETPAGVRCGHVMWAVVQVSMHAEPARQDTARQHARQGKARQHDAHKQFCATQCASTCLVKIRPVARRCPTIRPRASKRDVYIPDARIPMVSRTRPSCIPSPAQNPHAQTGVPACPPPPSLPLPRPVSTYPSIHPSLYPPPYMSSPNPSATQSTQLTHAPSNQNRKIHLLRFFSFSFLPFLFFFRC